MEGGEQIYKAEKKKEMLNNEAQQGLLTQEASRHGD